MRFAALIFAGLLPLVLPERVQVQTVRAAFQDNYSEVNGVRLHYVSVGQGPLVLFLHGYPSFWYQWKDQMAEIGRDHLAVGLDMRGYNLSSRPQGLEPYRMTHLVEDVRQVAEKIAGKNRKFVLVAHDWGANVAWVFAMFHPEMLEKLIIINGAHPFISERELRENPAQRGLNYYRANHRNPPFNDRHPASTIPSSWSAKEVTQGAASTIIRLPTLVIWGLKDTAILSGHLSGLDKWVPNLSVKLYPDDDHWVMLQKAREVASDIRRFIEDKNFPKESVYRPSAR